MVPFSFWQAPTHTSIVRILKFHVMTKVQLSSSKKIILLTSSLFYLLFCLLHHILCMMLYSISWPNFIVWFLLVFEIYVYITQYMHCNCLFSRFWLHKLWNQPYLSNDAVLIHHQKSVDKNLYLDRKNRL